MSDRVSERVEADVTDGLLGTDEPAPVLALRLESPSPFVFVSDHAGRRLPRALGDLGLAPSELERHIAYDIGILPVARQLAAAFEAPLVAQTYSRLAIDCNRPTHVAQSIPETSELTQIPGNHLLSPEQREVRIEALFRPYHDRIEALLDARSARGLPSILIAMHSFTPVYMGVTRPWTVGLLYNRDARLAGPLLELMNQDRRALYRRQVALCGRRPVRLHLAGARRAAGPAACRHRDPPGPDRRAARPGRLGLLARNHAAAIARRAGEWRDRKMSELSREVPLRPEQSGLLIIDVQNFCAHPDGAEFRHLSPAEREAKEG